MLFQRPDWKCTLGHCTFIPENNKTTCFTIKLDLKKLETVFRGPQANFLSLLWAFAPSAGKCKKFLHFSNTAFSHWLSLNKIEGKIKRLFNLSWVLLPANKRSLRTRKEKKKVRDCYSPFSPHKYRSVMPAEDRGHTLPDEFSSGWKIWPDISFIRDFERLDVWFLCTVKVVPCEQKT